MKKQLIAFLMLSISMVSYSQEIPQFGAEIYLESRQTTEQVTDKMV